MTDSTTPSSEYPHHRIPDLIKKLMPIPEADQPALRIRHKDKSQELRLAPGFTEIKENQIIIGARPKPGMTVSIFLWNEAPAESDEITIELI
jgi:hypothetical protein